jgi:hypothetical protein
MGIMTVFEKHDCRIGVECTGSLNSRNRPTARSLRSRSHSDELSSVTALSKLDKCIRSLAVELRRARETYVDDHWRHRCRV